MDENLTINVITPITSVNIVDDIGITSPPSEKTQPDPQALKEEKENLARLCTALQDAVNKLNQLHEQIFCTHREQIARFSVQIAQKILLREIQAGNYDIEKIIQETLKNAPTHQDVRIRLNPNDFQQYQQATDNNTTATFDNAKLIADPNIGPAQCIVETDKGTIQYLIDEHLKRITEALNNTE